ncbi:MAG TPA: M23 family peptidase, partial [Candidatus Thioglobus sp.]|nr:M23 family peptidase [Candidatus Thioglobus sp.]
MLIKLLVVIFISTSLGGCFSSSPKSRVIIVEKSINQYNINQTRLSNEVIPNKQTETTTTKNKVSKKSWSIPVAGKVLKTFSK